MQYNVTMCSVHVSGNGNNNAFCVYCWSTRHCKQYKNATRCTKILLWQICIAGNKKKRTRWLKYARYKLWLVYTQIVPVIFEPPCTYVFMYEARYFCEILIKSGVSRQILIKARNIEQMDMTKLTDAFSDSSSTPKIV
jgi:hypothetical protein